MTVHNGATTTLSNTLFNMTHVQQCSVKISLACRGMLIKATHGEYKSYYIKDVTGENHKCTTKALYVQELQQDLLAGTALLNAGYPVILENDPKIAVNFPVTNGEIDPATGLQLLNSIGLFFCETVPSMKSTKHGVNFETPLVSPNLDTA